MISVNYNYQAFTWLVSCFFARLLDTEIQQAATPAGINLGYIIILREQPSVQTVEESTY
jgi:hypothetical protein